MAEGGAPPAPIGGFPIASCRLKKLASQAWEGRARRTRPLSWGRLAARVHQDAALAHTIASGRRRR